MSNDQSDRAIDLNKKKRLRNQIKSLLKLIDMDNSWMNYQNILEQAVGIRDELTSLFFAEELSPFLMRFHEMSIASPYMSETWKTYAYQRMLEIKMSMTMLYDFLNTTMGEPIAQEFINDGLSEASTYLNDKSQPHPILFGSLMIRISIERALKTLCHLNNINYKPRELPSHINKLLSANGVYPEYTAAEVEARLKLLNAVIHDDATPPIGKIKETLDWASKFISDYLPGLPGQ